jgi:hypothetical protein
MGNLVRLVNDEVVQFKLTEYSPNISLSWRISGFLDKKKKLTEQ